MAARPSLVRGLAALAAALSCMSAHADPLGFYVGAGGGHSNVRNELDYNVFNPVLPGSFGVSAGQSGWKLIAGLRPISIIGAEVEYLDFGSSSASASVAPTPTQAGIAASVSSHPRAAAAFAVGYLPIPLPILDVYGKVGVASLRSSVHGTAMASCPLNLPCLVIDTFPYASSSTSSRVAYGAGAQLKFGNVGVRAEYERVHVPSGDPDLLSLAVTLSL